MGACTIEERPLIVKKKIFDAGFPNPFRLCIIRAPLDGLHSGAALERGRVRDTLHTVLTDSKVAVRCAARFNGTPSGRTRKPLQSHPRRGVDGSKNRAIMGGSLRRKRRSIGKQALRPLPKIFDSVRRILMRTSGWWCESISRCLSKDSRKIQQHANAGE